MWDENKQFLFDALRQRELDGTLTDEERLRLDELITELDREEEALLRPAMERHEQRINQLEDEAAQIETQNTALESIIKRQAELLARVQAFRDEFLKEHELLRAEYEQVVREPIHTH